MTEETSNYQFLSYDDADWQKIIQAAPSLARVPSEVMDYLILDPDVDVNEAQTRIHSRLRAGLCLTQRLLGGQLEKLYARYGVSVGKAIELFTADIEDKLNEQSTEGQHGCRNALFGNYEITGRFLAYLALYSCSEFKGHHDFDHFCPEDRSGLDCEMSYFAVQSVLKQMFDLLNYEESDYQAIAQWAGLAVRSMLLLLTDLDGHPIRH